MRNLNRERASGEPFNQGAGQAVDRIEERLTNLTPHAPELGESLARAAKQAEAAMQGVGRQALADSAPAMQQFMKDAATVHPVIDASQARAVSGPSGADTAPAWLTPGEFVVNASAPQRNAGLLAAMNKDVTLPGVTQHFAGGGSAGPNGPSSHVTATINVLPAPGMNPRDIARACVDELARLKERGRG